MANLWHKTLVYFGFADNVVDEIEDEDDDGTSEIFEVPPSVRKISRAESRRSSTNRGASPHIRPVSAYQSKVHVVEPKNFNDAQRIADKYKADMPVILNLQQVEPELSKRVIDFVSGLTYAVDGGIQKVAEKVFLLTPKNVEVSAEERRRLQEKGFFNQL